MKQTLTQIGTWTAHPAAFVIVTAYGLGWALFGHFDWHSGATLATWMMTLFIQRAEHRDTQALHGKLDEILRAQDGARSELTTLDEREPEEIEAHRNRAKP